MTAPATSHWSLRDILAATLLFLASAATVLWQDAHLAILWDVSYLLDTAFRITLGQTPYRDFPFAHAPLTFYIQAAIIKLTGRVFFHHTLYAALISGLGTVLTWRIALRTLRPKLATAWTTSLFLTLPLAVLGIYGIYPHPVYDCDCIFSILLCLYLLQRLTRKPTNTLAFLTGLTLVLPIFFKQNIGLPFLLTAIAGILVLLAIPSAPRKPSLLLLAGAATASLIAILLVHLLFGIHNYLHWTITFAAQRRLPGLHDILSIYAEPSLLWTLPCIAIAITLLRFTHHTATRILAFALLAAPFLPPLLTLLQTTHSDDRASALLALWPLLLILSAALALYNLRRPSLTTLLPFLILATVHGAFLSQQLWGSTYALWPLLTLLLATLFTSLATPNLPKLFLPALAAIIGLTLLTAGAFYLTSEDRLSYANIADGPLHHSTLPQLKGMATRGPYLPAFDQLIAFTAANIPQQDGVLLLNGEDPFFFTTGRAPQFPITLFDPATDPYTPADILPTVHAHNIHWLILNRTFQIKDDPTPYRTQILPLLINDFAPYATLDNYTIYHRP